MTDESTEPTRTQTARLEALGATRALLAHDERTARELVAGTADPHELASAAVGLAASVLMMVEGGTRARILHGLTVRAARS